MCPALLDTGIGVRAASRYAPISFWMDAVISALSSASSAIVASRCDKPGDAVISTA
jgi:hypothetical protein